MKLIETFQNGKNEILKTIIGLALCVGLYSCAVGSSIITGNVKPSINESDVKIYIEAPSKYETIGLIEASSDVEFSRQAAQDRVINNLKARAAKMGAKGVLLSNTGSQSSGTTGFYSNGIFINGSNSKITAQGKAIFVIQE